MYIQNKKVNLANDLVDMLFNRDISLHSNKTVLPGSLST
jgi:hypothetical protein